MSHAASNPISRTRRGQHRVYAFVSRPGLNTVT